MNSIFKRRSYRKFLDKEVSMDKIEMLLRAGMQAPSACDGRPWKFYVITNKDKLLELANATPYSMCAKNCSVAIVPYYVNNKLKAPDYIICDMSACVENILIEAEDIGLGAVWIGGAPVRDRIDSIRNILGLDKDIVPFCIIPVGYPVNRKDIDDRYDSSLVHFIK